MKKTLILILLFAATWIAAQEKPLTKEQILQLSETSPAAKDLLKTIYPQLFERPPATFESAIDLSNLAIRNRQLFLANNKFLGSINQSPFYTFTYKGILVDNAFVPSIQVINGRHIIVFELK